MVHLLRVFVLFEIHNVLVRIKYVRIPEEGGVKSKCRRLRAGDFHENLINIGQLKVCGYETMIAVNKFPAPRL